MNSLTEIILATGALGTAAFGLVEALKWTRLGESGFRHIRLVMGKLLFDNLAIAYGNEYEKILRSQYRGNHDELLRMLRQGVRLSLQPGNVTDMINALGQAAIDNQYLVKAIEQMHSDNMSPEARNALGRFELAVDTRIEAALARAKEAYIGRMRMVATVISLGTAVLIGFFMDQKLLHSIIIGLAAVPIAPVTKDIVAAISAASKALRGGR
jgi:hypothetical protein